MLLLAAEQTSPVPHVLSPWATLSLLFISVQQQRKQPTAGAQTAKGLAGHLCAATYIPCTQVRQQTLVSPRLLRCGGAS